MAKVEDRAVDSGVAGLRSMSDPDLVDWWKRRVSLIAAIPTDVARAGALVPQLRELARLPDAERRRLTKARIQAVVAAPADERQKTFAALKLAGAIDPDLVKSDQDIAKQLASEIPGAEEIGRMLGPS